MIGIAALWLAGCGVVRAVSEDVNRVSEGGNEQEAAANAVPTVESPEVASSAREETAREETAGEETAGEETAGEETAGEETAGEETAGEETATPDEDVPAPEQPPETELAARTPSSEPERRPEPTPGPHPDKLLTMSELDVMTKLGAPVSQRDEPPAHVWRYTTDFCALEVFFFLDVNDNSRRALSYDIQLEDDGPEDALTCYQEIERRHAAALESIDPR